MLIASNRSGAVLESDQWAEDVVVLPRLLVWRRSIFAARSDLRELREIVAPMGTRADQPREGFRQIEPVRIRESAIPTGPR